MGSKKSGHLFVQPGFLKMRVFPARVRYLAAAKFASACAQFTTAHHAFT